MSTSKKVNNLSNSYKNDKEKLAQTHFGNGGLAHGKRHGSGSHGGGKGNGNGNGGRMVNTRRKSLRVSAARCLCLGCLSTRFALCVTSTMILYAPWQPFLNAPWQPFFWKKAD